MMKEIQSALREVSRALKELNAALSPHAAEYEINRLLGLADDSIDRIVPDVDVPAP